MNTFNKYIKLILTVLFIGASIISAHAQGWKKGVQKLPKALGKKPPLTETTPVVRSPIAPRVPSTMAGLALPVQTVPNTDLHAKVERKIVKYANSNGKIIEYPVVPITEKTVQKIQNFNLTDYLTIATGLKDNKRQLLPKNEQIDFTKLITPKIPVYVPVLDVMIGPLMEDTAIQSIRQMNLTPKRKEALVAALKKTDQFFFIEEDGQVLLDTSTLTKVRSYEEALEKLAWGINSAFLRNILAEGYATGFVNLRNQQITNALMKNNIENLAQ